MAGNSRPAISRALAVGRMLWPPRTNSGSPKYRRKRTNEPLTAGWVTLRQWAARLTLRSRKTRVNTSIRFKSRPLNGTSLTDMTFNFRSPQDKTVEVDSTDQATVQQLHETDQLRMVEMRQHLPLGTPVTGDDPGVFKRMMVSDPIAHARRTVQQRMHDMGKLRADLTRPSGSGFYFDGIDRCNGHYQLSCVRA